MYTCKCRPSQKLNGPAKNTKQWLHANYMISVNIILVFINMQWDKILITMLLFSAHIRMTTKLWIKTKNLRVLIFVLALFQMLDLFSVIQKINGKSSGWQKYWLRLGDFTLIHFINVKSAVNIHYCFKIFAKSRNCLLCNLLRLQNDRLTGGFGCQVT